MKSKALFLRIMLYFFISVATLQVIAQQTRVDSIILKLKKVVSAPHIDSAALISIGRMIAETVLNDQQLTQLESVASTLKNEKDIGIYCLLKRSIQSSLNSVDADRAISYGHKNLKELENFKTPKLSWEKYACLMTLRISYRNSDRINEGFQYYSQLVSDALAKQDSTDLATGYYVLAGFYSTIGLMDQAIYNSKKSLSFMDTVVAHDEIYWDMSLPNGAGRWLNNMNVLGTYYKEAKQYDSAFSCFKTVMNIGAGREYSQTAAFRMVEVMLDIDSLQPVPALLNEVRSSISSRNSPPWSAVVKQSEALYNIKTGNYDKAEQLLNDVRELIANYHLPPRPYAGTMAPDYYFALLRQQQQRIPEAIVFLQKDIERMANIRVQLLTDYRLLANLYQSSGNGQKAAEAYEKYNILQDEVLEEQRRLRQGSFELEQQMNERELSITNLKNENKVAAITRNFIIGLAAVLLFLAVFAYNRYRVKQRDNSLLSTTLANLKATQSQLIQSEKMASLGELTAGIAHEIQNQLNFVNNFSEVSAELIEEAGQAIGNRQKAIGNSQADENTEIEQILTEIKQNLEKINHHGKRADAIVKGMLQHSQKNTGIKEPTDINDLADEYLRLAYHGIRAKENSFNATIKTDFDSAIPKLNIVPQDIGRVLLNLFNNAFYAVQEKKKRDPAFQPCVTVSTTRIENRIRISITDNGTGIPEKIREKIFQPFFTTKPTGEGTGLGLSLTYDIVKAHGGEIRFESLPGVSTTFVISLPEK